MTTHYPSERIKLAQSEYPIHELIQRRWSPRAFADRAVEPAKLLSVLEAARWSASSSNQQPWFFIVGQRGSETFARMVDCLMEGNVPWASNASVLIFTAASLKSARNDRPNRTALYDLGQAVQNMAVQATALGLHMHQMGGIQIDKINAEFQIPADHTAVTGIALGYLGDPESLENERHREGELATRERKPLREFVFGGNWGEEIGIGE
ncbi:MAG: nitroreductase family protein [Caldilineaceae bacterium]